MEGNPESHNTIKASKIFRKSTHTFLTHFHHFTSTPTLLGLPFSFCLLIQLSAAPSASVHRRLHSLLLDAGFPMTSSASHFLLLQLSQSLSSSLSSLPLSLSFLLLSKSSTLLFLKSLDNFHHHQLPLEFAYFPLLLTQICNILLLVAANSACFFLAGLAFTATGIALDPTPTWVSAAVLAAGAVFYSVVVANAVVVCNLSLISSGWEGKGGPRAILRACTMIRGRVATALILSLPANLGMAVAEVVFRRRIYHSGATERPVWAVSAEAMLIAYLYSVVIVGDVIVGCLFYMSCKEDVKEEEKEYQSDPIKLRALEEGL